MKKLKKLEYPSCKSCGHRADIAMESHTDACTLPKKPVFGKATVFTSKIGRAIEGRWVKIGYLDGPAQWLFALDDSGKAYNPKGDGIDNAFSSEWIDSPEQIIKVGPKALPPKG
jgi:hypothetical protein